MRLYFNIVYIMLHNVSFFSISAVTPQEAVWFNLDWKIPCVLHYTAIPAPAPTQFVNPLTYDVFGEDKCIARNGGTRGITFTPLSSDEMPQKGTSVHLNSSCSSFPFVRLIRS